MSAGPWIFTAIGWLLIAAGAGITARALFGDRARGRRRCPRCWYDMRGVPGVTCPECGHAAGDERALSRTRRRWRRAAAGLVLAGLSYGAFVGPDVAERGLRAAIPGTVLVCWPLNLEDWTNPWALPGTDGRWATVLREELDFRLKERRLADWQVSVLLGRTRRRCEARGEYGVPEPQHATLDTLMRAPGLGPSDAWALEALEARLASLGLEFAVEPRAWPSLGPFEAEGPSLAASLDAVAGSMGAEWIAQGRGVRLVARETWEEPHRENSRVAIYDVGDVAPVRVVWVPRHNCQCSGDECSRHPLDRVVDREAIESLAAIVTELVSPEQWFDGGGANGAVRVIGESLVIRATPAMHVAVERLLAIMRQALHDGPGAAAGEAAEPGESPYVRAYNVADLVPPDGRAPGENPWPVATDIESLVKSLCTLVAPEGWIENGGIDAHSIWFEPLLMVKAPADTHASIQALLASSRSAPAR